MVSWDPGSCAQLAAERARPFHDLLARVDAPAPRRVVDLGCGPGDLFRRVFCVARTGGAGDES